jgi:hypothetical protein
MLSRTALSQTGRLTTDLDAVSGRPTDQTCGTGPRKTHRTVGGSSPSQRATYPHVRAAPAAQLARRQRRALPWEARAAHAGPWVV